MNKMKGSGDISRQCVQITENRVSFSRQHLKNLQPVYEHVLMTKTGHQKVKNLSCFMLVTYVCNKSRTLQTMFVFTLSAVGTRLGLLCQRGKEKAA